METLINTKVSKIVAQNYKTASVFTRYGIDFCCNGGIPLKKACEDKQLDPTKVVDEVQAALGIPEETDYNQLSLTQLVNHIVSKHHSYVEATIPVLQAYLSKLCKVHGERHPELFEINQLFDGAAGALTAHMKKEEFILFPFIKSLEEASNKGYPLSEPHFGHIDNPIHMMEEEHSTEGERFREIARLSNNYQAPADGCQTYQVAYAVLSEFEQDLHLHIHLENNVLFPKSQELFRKLYQ